MLTLTLTHNVRGMRGSAYDESVGVVLWGLRPSVATQRATRGNSDLMRTCIIAPCAHDGQLSLLLIDQVLKPDAVCTTMASFQQMRNIVAPHEAHADMI